MSLKMHFFCTRNALLEHSVNFGKAFPENLRALQKNLQALQNFLRAL